MQAGRRNVRFGDAESRDAGFSCFRTSIGAGHSRRRPFPLFERELTDTYQEDNADDIHVFPLEWAVRRLTFTLRRGRDLGTVLHPIPPEKLTGENNYFSVVFLSENLICSSEFSRRFHIFRPFAVGLLL